MLSSGKRLETSMTESTERKRSAWRRVLQEAKHLKSLQKQSAKANSAPKNPADPAGSSCVVGPGLKDSGVNEAYLQGLKNDLQVIADKLGDLKSELPVPIVQANDDKGGVQEHAAASNDKMTDMTTP